MLPDVVGASILLVVGDDEERSRLEWALSEEGWRVIPAQSGAQARQAADDRRGFAVAVVNNQLSDERGFEVIRSVKGPGVSIVALVRDEDTMLRIAGRKLGVNHYLRSPVNPLELVALVEQILGEIAQPIHVRDLEIDPASKRVRRGGCEVQLSRSEFDLLYTLDGQPDRFFSLDELRRKVRDEYTRERTAAVYVQRLRVKLGGNTDEPELIETVWGHGYRLGPD